MTTVEAEKAEAMRRYNNRKSFGNILRAAAVATTVVISLQAAGDWFYRTGVVFITDRSVVFVFVNILVALIFVLSCDENNETSAGNDTEPDLYDQHTSSSNNNNETTSSSCDAEPDLCDQYTSSSAVIEEKVEDDDDDSKKQIVPAFIAEAVTKGIYRRTKSEMKREINRPVMEIRRTESAKERLSSEKFQLKADEEVDLKAEAFIMKMRSLHAQEKQRLQYHEDGLLGSGYGSC
ncbi:hypothetical protein V5N11_029007 [Cardamine amara subsp. amara]|uniref:Uncharacterized protein n=1 Tax=Cardamine amara subsp. amara TaxID=228776 RepID=A0ABD0ZKH3_CARAN